MTVFGEGAEHISSLSVEEYATITVSDLSIVYLYLCIAVLQTQTDYMFCGALAR